VGNLHRQVDIDGSQTVSVPGANSITTNNGGFLALSSNIGNHSTRDWTLMPEFGGILSWQAWTHTKLSMGYSILYLDQIARATDQVDIRINPNLLPPSTSSAGSPVPAFNLNKGNVWVQALSLGVEFDF